MSRRAATIHPRQNPIDTKMYESTNRFVILATTIKSGCCYMVVCMQVPRVGTERPVGEVTKRMDGAGEHKLSRRGR